MAGKKRVPARAKAKKEFKPQGFTKQEWITIGIVVAVIAVLIIGYFLLRGFFDGSLRVSDGKVQAEENWIVVNTGTSSSPKYYKLGTVSPVDGYKMEREALTGDENVPTFVFKPEVESPAEDVTMMAAKGGAEEMASKVLANYASYLQNAVPGEVAQKTLGGRIGWSFSCDYEDVSTVAAEATPAPEATAEAEATPAPEATPAAETATRAARTVGIYFDAPQGMSILVSASAKADDAAALPSLDELYAMLDPFIAGMRIEGEPAATPAADAAVPPAERAPEEPPAASAGGTPTRPDPHAPGTIWGLHVPGTPVQRMAKSLAVGFATIDPEETSRVVHSADDGANWWVLPREQWGEDV